MEQLDIVKLIEDNPITKLSNHYNIKLLTKVKENFTDFEQQLFLSSFYCYLNCHPFNDFIIDLDNVWKWLGFNQKYNAERLLERFFTIDKDYKCSLLQSEEQKKGRGGHNIKKILLNIDAFKQLCLKAGTKKANEIHKYYIKLERILQETIEEECSELKLQLQHKDNIIIQKQKEVEQAIINQFPVNTECIYFGTIDNTNLNNERLIKFGHTNDLFNRVSYHKKQYNNFVLKHAFKVQNKVEIENLIKSNSKIKPQIRTIQIEGKNKTEIIAYNNQYFTIEHLTKIIKDIVQSKIYSMENFLKITKRNEELEQENLSLNEKVSMLEKTNLENIIKIKELTETLTHKEEVINSYTSQEMSVYQNALLLDNDMNQKFNEFINQICIVRNDVDELSVNIEGRFRIWNGVKPKKDTFHALKNYLDTRFKPIRINGQHGYSGIKLKNVEYKKTYDNSDVETFIFNVCSFSDTGKILNYTLLDEYQKWKTANNKFHNDSDIKDIKEYLNKCKYVIKATVWTNDGSNEGYYGLSLKNKYVSKLSSSTGKKVFKKDSKTNNVLNTWNTIADASLHECVSKAKMSRFVKNKTIINEDYYYDTNQ